MSLRVLRLAAFAAIAALLLAGPASAQSGDTKAGDKQPPKPAEASKEAPKKVDEYDEAAKAINGPAGNAECVKIGRNAVSLLWRDDLDTAFRHLDLYDRFGCPGGHVQMTFRCVLRQGDLDPKAAEKLNARIHACWINPSISPSTAATATAPAAGTTTQ
ncbi:MAG: beta-1-3, beta-1-6-glucan biosynthesis protein [Pseudorhodoplanes sp.]